MLRADKPWKYVIFITDANNPSTASEIGDMPLPPNVIHRTWQQLAAAYPFDMPFQIRALWDAAAIPTL